MITKPTPGKNGLRERLRNMEELAKKAIKNANDGNFVVNALLWKHGYKNRPEIKEVVDEYLAHMEAKLKTDKEQALLKLKPEVGPAPDNNVIEMQNFVDPAILAKVAQFSDSTATDSSSVDEEEPS